jgi:hypothetical protein
MLKLVLALPFAAAAFWAIASAATELVSIAHTIRALVP